MKKHVYLLLILAIGSFFNSFSQSTKSYFDRLGISTSATNAYYYRVNTGGNEYKCYYLSSDGIFFTGTILKASTSNEADNKFSGDCKWYYKNGQIKMERHYDAQGLLEGTSTYYYESGKLSKKEEYKNGKLVDNKYIEYDESGASSKVFVEDFDNNYNDWALYSSEKGSAAISNGKLVLTSLNKIGISRYISVSSNAKDYTLETFFTSEEFNEKVKIGLVYGFKDWDNYNFFVITPTSFYVGSIFEGVENIKAEGMYSADIKKEGNLLKIISLNGKDVFSINGTVNFKGDHTRTLGHNKGLIIGGKGQASFENLIFKELKSGNNSVDYEDADLDVNSTGSGFFVSKSGYILTNYHVIDKANQIYVEVFKEGIAKTYAAEMIQADKINDLAIIKIRDDKFSPLSDLRYSIDNKAVSIGAKVFTIGYPLALNGMGKNAKFSEGSISSKTGYNNNINSYQTSVPIQPGNSGSPLFSNNGQLIGVMNAVVAGGDNVSYAIKTNYVKTLLDVLPQEEGMLSDVSISSLSLEDKIKVLSNYVVLIKIK